MSLLSLRTIIRNGADAATVARHVMYDLDDHDYQRVAAFCDRVHGCGPVGLYGAWEYETVADAAAMA